MIAGMAIKSAEFSKRLGVALRIERTRLKMTQEELALESGLSLNYTGEIERGEKMASLETIVRLAGALKMTGAELLAKARL